MTVHEGRIYQLKLFCDKDYPEKPPSVRFHSRINMTCVNHETGLVESKKFGLLANWRREYTMEDILTQLKKEMAASHNRKLNKSWNWSKRLSITSQLRVLEWKLFLIVSENSCSLISLFPLMHQKERKTASSFFFPLLTL
ncbi:hypothetical protein Goklo_021813 [Gossypium klotzschianum]|uniref:UBC core domain-containing protein n=1 Tax=Gossypium klotzschianum TaxID=34286 RepID=A0A7J8UX95_9ROSI|nr:hypothetical protein [Gossypium klotzschianum]